ncbi:MAG: homogentisate 1,2-dioxygenase, partial [Frankiales bacterium]|nr:homogentisate 1,2-dioxygenase [Frankiales bacterium]
MPYYRSVGDIPRKRHIQFRKPDGSLYAEELMGVEGFSSDSALLYHRHAPTAVVDAVAVDDAGQVLVANHPLKPRHFKTHKLDAGSTDVVTGRQLLLGNDDIRISYVVATQPSPLYRNAA